MTISNQKKVVKRGIAQAQLDPDNTRQQFCADRDNAFAKSATGHFLQSTAFAVNNGDLGHGGNLFFIRGAIASPLRAS